MFVNGTVLPMPKQVPCEVDGCTEKTLIVYKMTDDMIYSLRIYQDGSWRDWCINHIKETYPS